MKYHVKHLTKVSYQAMARLARFNLRLKPAEWPGQTLMNYVLEVTPTPSTIATLPSPYVGNI